jgi:flavin-dependent dehydrogenase
MRIENESRVAIIGGGPAGCFSAIHLLNRAREAGLRLDVRIFDPRFGEDVKGVAACKGCAGIVSANAVQAIESIGLNVPARVVQEVIEEYRVHILGQIIRLPQPRPGRKILSVYRGRGPRTNTGEPVESLDSYLLSEAVARGAAYVPERVRSLEWGTGPVVRTETNTFAADFIVLATGVNHRPITDSFFDYSPPPTGSMAQDEIRKPPDWPAHTVVAFFGEPKGLVFGAMVPKKQFLNVSLMGYQMGPDPIHDFYRAQKESIDKYFSAVPEGCCGCSPRVPLQSAQRYFGDRWVAVGDAAVARLYKDGIFSANFTAESAMRTAFETGIDAESFRTGYAPTARRIALDNRYGEILFRISTAIVQSSRLSAAFLYSLRLDERRPPEKKILARLIWGMLTGDESYRELFRMSFRPRELAEIGREILRRSRQPSASPPR